MPIDGITLGTRAGGLLFHENFSKMKHTLIFLLIPLFSFAQRTEVDFSKLVPFRVTSVFDGDGFKGWYNDTLKGEIRLFGVDAPEKRGYSSRPQTYGNEAGDSLRTLVKDKTVYLDTLTLRLNYQTDRWGRTLAVCYMADTVNLNFLIVERGWAWAANVKNSRIPNFNDVLRNAQREARDKKRGLWAGRNPYSPALHRKRWSIFN